MNLTITKRRSRILQKLESMGFIRISEYPMERFWEHQRYTKCVDLSYSLLYALELDYGYRIMLMDGNPVVVGFDLTGELFASILPEVPEHLMRTVKTVIDLLSRLHVDFVLKYIDAAYVDLYKQNGFDLTFDPDFSDYIYKSDEFVQLLGNRNKSKRQEYQEIVRRYDDRRYTTIDQDNYSDVLRIFDQWCDSHPCEDCVWGCERRVFSRLSKLMARNPEHYFGGIVYLNGKPMSFGLAEKLNDDSVCYLTQKNADVVGGLTYYLHYCMAHEHLDVPYINWGEDMGVAGLRTNKQKYHPCHMEHKYEISFRCGSED